MTGSGSVLTSTGVRVDHTFELHCDASQAPNHLQVKWGRGNTFTLVDLTTASCSDDSSIEPDPPAAGFDTHRGSGMGRYNKAYGATVEWMFTDAGEPGRNDFVDLLIRDISGNVLLQVSGNLAAGNHQAHGG